MGEEIKPGVDPDKYPETEVDIRIVTEAQPEPWVDKNVKKPYIDTAGNSTILYTKGKGERDEAYAFHSGVGDNDDLLVKAAEHEIIEEDFKYASRYRGKKKHEVSHYPEVPFEYGLHYEGELYTEANESPFKHRVDAYPAKNIEYSVTMNDPQPSVREWEAEVTMDTVIPKKEYRYAVNWKGLKELESQINPKTLFTSSEGKFIGPGPNSTWKLDGSIVKEIDNRSHFSGIVAKEFYDWDSYEAEFDFKCIKATGINNDSFAKLVSSNGSLTSVPGADDDMVSFIFRAKPGSDGKVDDFYMFCWEADRRVYKSWRPGNLNGYNIVTGNLPADSSYKESEAAKKYQNHVSKYNEPFSLSRWNSYVKNSGWGMKHARIYKVTNGEMKLVSTVKDKLSGTPGWKQDWSAMNTLNSVRIFMNGRNVKIYTQSYTTGNFSDSNYRLRFEFEMASGFDTGSVGLGVFSQSVEYHKIRITRWDDIEGRVPSSGWSKNNSSGTTTVASQGKEYVGASAQAKAGPGKRYEVTSISGEEDPATKSIGSISTKGPNGAIKVSTTNPPNAGIPQKVTLSRSGTVNITPNQTTPDNAVTVFRSINQAFGAKINAWKAQHPGYVTSNLVLRILKPTPDFKDWDLEGQVFTMWNSKPDVIIKTKEYIDKVYAYMGWVKRDLAKEFGSTKYATFTVKIREETFNPDYDELVLKGKILSIRTTEWYKGIYPADIKDEGLVTTEADVFVNIPPMPEHYVEPSTGEVMYHGYEDVHFLLAQLFPVSVKQAYMGFKSKFETENTKITKTPKNVINGFPIIWTDQINDQVQIKER